MSAVNDNLRIHPTAIVDAAAVVDKSAKIGPYAIVEAGAVIGSNCHLNSHAIVRSGAELEEGVFIDSFAVVGGNPQDLHFDPTLPSKVKIGRNTILREGATVHRAHTKDGVTIVGENCYLMSNSHVGHDCVIADNVVIASGVLLAGHVQIAAFAFLGGGSAFHQFVRVGEGAIVGGLAAITHDVPPFVLAADRSRCYGINLIGLKRRGLPNETIAELKRLYKLTMLKKGDVVKYAQQARQEGAATTPQGRTFLDFFKEGKRQFIHSHKTDVE